MIELGAPAGRLFVAMASHGPVDVVAQRVGLLERRLGGAVGQQAGQRTRLVVRQVLPWNPASSVRGPKHVVRRGKTPVLTAGQARELR